MRGVERKIMIRMGSLVTALLNLKLDVALSLSFSSLARKDKAASAREYPAACLPTRWVLTHLRGQRAGARECLVLDPVGRGGLPHDAPIPPLPLAQVTCEPATRWAGVVHPDRPSSALAMVRREVVAVDVLDGAERACATHVGAVAAVWQRKLRSYHVVVARRRLRLPQHFDQSLGGLRERAHGLHPSIVSERCGELRLDERVALAPWHRAYDHVRLGARLLDGELHWRPRRAVDDNVRRALRTHRVGRVGVAAQRQGDRVVETDTAAWTLVRPGLLRHGGVLCQIGPRLEAPLLDVGVEPGATLRAEADVADAAHGLVVEHAGGDQCPRCPPWRVVDGRPRNGTRRNIPIGDGHGKRQVVGCYGTEIDGHRHR
eukprot:4333065-Prymnesium_polylepis.1